MKCKAAGDSSTPATQLQNQNILIFQANVSDECAGRCQLLVSEIPNATAQGAGGKRPFHAEFPTTTETQIQLEAPLRPWNTLTVSIDSHATYAAKIICTGRCEANLFQTQPLLLWSGASNSSLTADSTATDTASNKLTARSSPASLVFTKMPSQDASKSPHAAAGEVFWVQRRSDLDNMPTLLDGIGDYNVTNTSIISDALVTVRYNAGAGSSSVGERACMVCSRAGKAALKGAGAAWIVACPAVIWFVLEKKEHFRRKQ